MIYATQMVYLGIKHPERINFPVLTCQCFSQLHPVFTLHIQIIIQRVIHTIIHIIIHFDHTIYHTNNRTYNRKY